MAYDPNMSRWIMASFRTWFDATKLNEIPIFYEYTRHKNITQNETMPEAQQYAEFRLNGPFYSKVTAIEEYYDVMLNVIVTQDLNEGKADEMDMLIGSIQVCFTDCIPIYRYGIVDLSGPNGSNINDSSLVGGMLIHDDKMGSVEVLRFGQANPDTLLSQTSIEANYRMKLVNGR